MLYSGTGTGRSAFIAASALYWEKDTGRAVRAVPTSAGKAWVQHSALMALRGELHAGRFPAPELVDRRVRDLRAHSWTISTKSPEPPAAAPQTRTHSLLFSSSYSRAAAVARSLMGLWGARDVPSDLNAAQLLDEIEAYGAVLWRIVEVRLRFRTDWGTPCFRRLPSSPCGILKLATPNVPRGPDALLHSQARSHSWALAA
ncbi:hypothetical protein ACTVZO_14075 [Streptomyces sp. IBSNAI002]|uniref:hypothetical protein n=1 Tax=Streptomyces sp. IBSNAI002 TaxID=3457500 RepID=UPI003FD4FD1F